MQRRAPADTGALIARQMAAGEALGYSAVARTFHWLTAALVLTMLPIGISIATFDLGPAVEDPLYHSHRSIGALVLVITAARLTYRLFNPAPPLPVDMPAWQHLAALATHWGLYALLIVQPIVGWIATSAYRAPIIVFGLFELPPIWAENRALSENLFGLHRLLGIAMAALILAHIAGALFHQFVRRDNLMQRMWR
jgi:cytochrome b561